MSAAATVWLIVVVSEFCNLYSVICHLVSGEKLAFSISSRTQHKLAHASNAKGATVPDPEAPPATAGRTGVAIGILVVTLLALAFYFYWRTTGARDENGRRPQPVGEVSAVETLEAIALVG
jgi:hypothetical protein